LSITCWVIMMALLVVTIANRFEIVLFSISLRFHFTHFNLRCIFIGMTPSINLSYLHLLLVCLRCLKIVTRLFL